MRALDASEALAVNSDLLSWFLAVVRKCQHLILGDADPVTSPPRWSIIPGVLPLVSKATREIGYVVAHLPEVAERLDGMIPVSV